ncbi:MULTISPECIES: NUDIX hydrolase [Eisenbergiella]|uniref:NUDIX domain-containing protein n=1 Tax=Eisenbergiella porci TaxID=2652274 RepID=A0A6N7WCP9_9FIRM|nr:MULTISPECIES: NUDIX hydrolase [Eisenbergiella]MDY2654110.1 NUDIX hydrolase [Eisenbergiella porci]MSS87515.1 NUDIX domain-containing protein [Eisenbergiella porci]
MLPERLKRRVIYESDWIDLYADTVRMPDGSIIEPYHVLHYPHNSVSVVIYNNKDEILMLRSKRYTAGGLEWEIPAGRVEKNESPEDAARRECMEETGCELEDLSYLGYQNPQNGMTDFRVHMYAAHVSTENGNFDKNEVDSKLWVKRDEVMDWLKNNVIRCGVSMLTLLYADRFYEK